MNFSEYDIKILVVSAITLVLISATAGATPLAGGFGEPPRYDSDAEITFNVPDQPGATVFTQGEISYGAGIEDYRQNSIVVNGDQYLVRVSVINGSDGTNEDVTVGLLVDNGTGQTFNSTQVNFNETVYMNVQDFGVEYTYSERTNSTATVSWELVTNPQLGGDGNGGIWGALMQIASWIKYFTFLCAFAVEALFNSIVFVSEVIVGIVTYIFSVVSWITSGYGSIIGASPNWAKIFVTIPAFLVGIELLKLLTLTVQVLWIS